MKAELSLRLSAVDVSPRTVLHTPARPSTRSYHPRPAPAAGGFAARVRTAAETLLAAAMMVPALPVGVACAALIRLTSRGPAVYTQQRVGRGGRVFTLYKLRSMVHDCERETGAKWCVPGDPRVTPVGRVLRKLHLDELPQLWNVLRGDMSLIGPRPERPEICRKLRQVVPGYDRRHAVKPGITGFAQVHLPPDTCVRSVKNKVAYDLFYIRRRSLRMEALILACTGLKMIGLTNVYRRPPRRDTA